MSTELANKLLAVLHGATYYDATRAISIADDALTKACEPTELDTFTPAAEYSDACRKIVVPAIQLPQEVSEMLTPYEIEQLRQDQKEASAYARKAFEHLRPL